MRRPRAWQAPVRRRATRPGSLAAALAIAAACSSTASAPGPRASSAPASSAPATTSDAPGASSEQERLAALQHAMNQLDEGAQLCWGAAAAVDGYDLAGELALRIDIARPSSAVTLVRDTAKSPRLTACLERLLSAYAWAAPLVGQSVQLPFAFRAPRGQSVIDRRWIPAIGQGALAVRTLLDERNTGNAAASMFEIELAAGARTGLRVASRTEAWLALTPGAVRDASGAEQALSIGDVLLVPAGGLRELVAPPTGALRAALVVTPGGEEGAARAGALPTPEAPLGPRGTPLAKGTPALRVARAATAQRYPRPGGEVQLALDPEVTGHKELSASLLTFAAGAAVPLHQHAAETELLYILDGAGTLTLGSLQLSVEPTSVLQIPPGVPHAFTATAPLRALQLYTPAGPEQRFKAPPPPTSRP